MQVGRGQTAVEAAAVTSSCDRGSQTGPQGAGEEGPRRLMPGVPGPPAALASVCSPTICCVPSPPCLPQVPAAAVSFHRDLGLQAAASLTPGQRGPHLGICAPLGMSVSLPPRASGTSRVQGSVNSTPHVCGYKKQSQSLSHTAGWVWMGRCSAFPEASPQALLSPQ